MTRLVGAAFLVWILAEIAAFAAAGQVWGVLPVLLVVLLSAVLGGLVLRAAGTGLAAALAAAGRTGRDPSAALLAGGARLVAALLLIQPGLLGDAAGLLLLVPGIPGLIAHALGALVQRSAAGPRMAPPRPRDPFAPPRPPVVEAEWEEIAPPPPSLPPSPPARASGGPSRPPSGWTRQ
jgi:UPF0716 protein FxsA